jgi:hypothetical protein
MSQETPINQINNQLNTEESDLVNNILNDIKSSRPSGNGDRMMRSPQQGGPPPQQGGPQQGQPSQEQIKMMQQQQMAMRQQQIMQQQQQMQLEQQEQQELLNKNKTNIINNTSPENIIDNLKKESKFIFLVIFLTIVFNIEQVDELFKSQSFFITENGTLNLQCIFLKGIIIGIIYYLVKTYLL